MYKNNLNLILLFSIGLIIFITGLYVYRNNVSVIVSIPKQSGISELPGTDPGLTPEPVPDTDQSLFKCPQSEVIGCMPIVSEDRKVVCSSTYLNWAKKNCPNFKGAAL